MNHVGSSVGSGNSLAARNIDAGDSARAGREFAVAHFAAMDEQSGNGRLDVINLEHRSINRRDRTVVTQLSTCFGIERGAIQNDFGVLSNRGDGL